MGLSERSIDLTVTAHTLGSRLSQEPQLFSGRDTCQTGTPFLIKIIIEGHPHAAVKTLTCQDPGLVAAAMKRGHRTCRAKNE